MGQRRRALDRSAHAQLHMDRHRLMAVIVRDITETKRREQAQAG